MDFGEWLAVDEARFKGLKRMFQQEHPDMPSYVQNDLYNTRIAYPMSKQVDQHGSQVNTARPTQTPQSPMTRQQTPQPMAPSQIMDRAGFRNDKWGPAEILQGKSGQGVTPGDFNNKTQEYFLDRRFGYREETQIRADKQRMKKQKELTQSAGQGQNEPVIVRETSQGFQLLEGWHRTMNLLLGGCPQDQHELLKSGEGYWQDFDFSKWTPVTIRAFVARGAQAQPGTPAQPQQDPEGTGEYIPSGSTGSYHPAG